MNELLIAAKFTFPEYEWREELTGKVIRYHPHIKGVRIAFVPKFNNDDLLALMDKVMMHECCGGLTHEDTGLWLINIFNQDQTDMETLRNKSKVDLFIKSACLLSEDL